MVSHLSRALNWIRIRGRQPTIGRMGANCRCTSFHCRGRYPEARPSARKITTLVNATPIHSESGTIESAVGVIQDMTPIADVERLRNDFLGMVSHELRAPLAAIKGSSATVLGSSTPFDVAEMRQFFGIIDEQPDRLRELINGLLDITRIEAGMLSVTPQPTAGIALVDEAKNTFLRSGGRNAIEVEVSLGLPLIDADRLRILQVLNNLLSNASKFSPESSTIMVTASQEEQNVAISVTDVGRGITASQLPHLFKKYYQSDSDSDKGWTAANGLGLAICKGIVEAHGGRIWAKSAGEGRGTRITFAVPVAGEVASTSVAQVV